MALPNRITLVSTGRPSMPMLKLVGTKLISALTKLYVPPEIDVRNIRTGYDFAK